MKRYVWLWTLVVTMFWFSCYDDKGNYDYHDINSVEIVDVNIDNQRAYLGDVITFTPELEFALDSMALNFDYKWELDGKVLGTERVLEWTADTAGMFWEGFVFTVTDTELDISYVYDQISFQVMDPYVVNNAGWVVLSEVNGTSRLSLIQDVYDYEQDEPEYMPIVDLDMYAKCNNGESLGGKPLGLGLIWTTPEWFFDEAISQVLVLQEGGPGPVYVDGSNFKKSIAVSEEFFSGVLPSGESFTMVEDHTHVTALYTSDGDMYLRIKEDPAIIFSGKFDQPQAIDKGMKITHHAAVRGYEAPSALLFDAANSRFLVLYDVTDNSWEGDIYVKNGALREIVEDDNLTTTSLKDMGDVDMLYVGPYLGTDWENHYLLVYRDNNVESVNCGKVVVQDIRLSQDYGSSIVVYKALPEWEIPFPGETYLNGNTVFAAARTDAEILFFSGGANNSLLYAWPYEGDNGGTVAPRAIFDFEGAAIKHICVSAYNNMLVAVEDGSVYQFDVTEQMLKEGGIKENSWWYKYEENFGNVCALLRLPSVANDW